MEKRPINPNLVLKLVAIAGILLASLSVSYYFGIFLPHKDQLVLDQQKEEQLIKNHTEQTNNLFNKNSECQKYKDRIDEAQNAAVISKMKVISGIFYSSKTNACLYAGMDWDDKIKVKDVLSGQTLFEETYFHNPDKKVAGTVGEEVDRIVSEWK